MSSASRLIGVDVARGLAVLGMFGAHLSATSEFDWADAESWSDIVNGRSSILFALLAGVSLAILSGRDHPVEGPELARARLRIVVRALLVVAIGASLMLLGTNIAVILPYYGVLFVLALPLLRWRSRTLFALAAALAVTMPVLVQLLATAIGDPDRLGGWIVLADIFVIGPYPVLIWLSILVAGLGIGRLDLAAARVAPRLLAAGTAVAVIGYTLGELAYASAVEPLNPAPLDWTQLATTAPHSGSPFEVVGSTGVAIAVLGLCLVVGRGIRWPLFALAAVGSMALTAYTAQVVLIAALGVPVPGEPGSWAWAWFALGALVFCSAWSLTLGRGPLERLLTWASNGIARLSPADRLESASVHKENQKS